MAMNNQQQHSTKITMTITSTMTIIWLLSTIILSIKLQSIDAAAIIGQQQQQSSASSEKFQSDQSDIIDQMARLTSPSNTSPFATSLRSNMDSMVNNELDVDGTNHIILNRLFNMLERKKLPPNWMIHQALLSGQHKRQIRYQQCYFNPISCF
ncbi:allatostatin C [Dermatophagoides farinae]|uniref:allatostatin C n=1 Tax=Dermatophagoides farinae TaxID=6954 RepID=UPI003F6028CF